MTPGQRETDARRAETVVTRDPGSGVRVTGQRPEAVLTREYPVGVAVAGHGRRVRGKEECKSGRDREGVRFLVMDLMRAATR